MASSFDLDRLMRTATTAGSSKIAAITASSSRCALRRCSATAKRTAAGAVSSASASSRACGSSEIPSDIIVCGLPLLRCGLLVLLFLAFFAPALLVLPQPFLVAALGLLVQREQRLSDVVGLGISA